MTNFRKIGPNSWGLATDEDHQPGDVVMVTMKNGETKPVTLGQKALQNQQYGKWVYHIATAKKAATQVNIGDLAGIQALFATAKKHLKYPKITLSVPALSETIRISVAGPKAKASGTLNVTSMTQKAQNGWDLFYGRVNLDGTFESFKSEGVEIAKRLAEFAADPAHVAGEHGRLTGNCCFCHLPLKDERSTAVGYGSTCAKHYGLPWGSKPQAFAQPTEKWQGSNEEHDGSLDYSDRKDVKAL